MHTSTPGIVQYWHIGIMSAYLYIQYGLISYSPCLIGTGQPSVPPVAYVSTKPPIPQAESKA